MPSSPEQEAVGNPVVTREDETFNVLIEVADGSALFKFESPVFSNRDLETTLICTVIIPGMTSRLFESRLNVYSNSSREAYARQLTSAFGKEVSWVLVLSQACAAFSGAYKAVQAEKIYSKNSIVSKPTLNLIAPFLEENSPNIIFGKGGSGKTFLALRMAMSLASWSPFLGEMPEKPTRTLFVDYENSKETFSDRIDSMRVYCPGFTDEHEKSLFYFSPDGMPFHEIKETISKVVKEKEIGLIIIDSAALACGGAPEDAQNAIRFFNALNSLKVTTLTIAHETKSENGNYVFGSVFFHNSARNIWNVKIDREQEEDVIHVGLMHRKCNNGKLRSPRAARIYFGKDGIDINPEGADRFYAEQGVKSQILRLLGEGPKTLQEITDGVGTAAKETIKVRLNDLKNKGLIENPGKGEWQIKAETAQVTPPSAENDPSVTDYEKIFG